MDFSICIKHKKYVSWFELYNPFVTDEMTMKDWLYQKTFSGDLIWQTSDYSREEAICRAKYSFLKKFRYSKISCFKRHDKKLNMLLRYNTG